MHAAGCASCKGTRSLISITNTNINQILEVFADGDRHNDNRNADVVDIGSRGASEQMPARPPRLVVGVDDDASHCARRLHAPGLVHCGDDASFDHSHRIDELRRVGQRRAGKNECRKARSVVMNPRRPQIEWGPEEGA